MKTERQKLKKKLEKLVKDYVKQRDNNTCQYCGKVVGGVNCHASHVIPVSRDGRLAFDDKNLKVLCYHDHINGWHKHPIEFGNWYQKKFPERWEYLQEQFKENQSKGTIEIEWLKERINFFKNKL